MNKLKKLSLALMTCGAVTSSSLVSADAFSTESSLTLASQYLFRGFDLSQEDPALQGDVIVNHESGFWFGAWATNYDVGADDGVEVDVLLGYDFSLNDDVSFGVGLTEYTYTGDTDSSTEYYVSVSVSNFSFTYYDDTDLDTSYYSLDAEFDLQSNFSLALHAGKNDPDGGSSNNDYSVTLNYAASDSLSLFATYSDNDLDIDGAEDYFVVGAGYTF